MDVKGKSLHGQIVLQERLKGRSAILRLESIISGGYILEVKSANATCEQKTICQYQLPQFLQSSPQTLNSFSYIFFLTCAYR
jgi:hypothetical protein